MTFVVPENVPMQSLTDLANFLRSIPEEGAVVDGEVVGFDMENTDECRYLSRHPCGSACCIGGWVKLLRKDLDHHTLSYAVASLSEHRMNGEVIMEFYTLCFPSETPSAWDSTPAQAARAVEILRDTGKCDWARAMREA